VSDIKARLEANLSAIKERIADAARRAGRNPQSVRLVVVTKYASADLARQVAELGYMDLAESRPQELWAKAALLQDLPVRWHLVGHLQRNKVRRTLPITSWIHSVDSVRLLDEIQHQADALGLRPQVLLEVNVSGDAAKHGFAPDELPAVVARLAEWPSLQVCGLMAMAGLTHMHEAAAADFRRLRQLRDALADTVPPPHHLTELSMGMSGDFEEAVLEGATMVRVGSAVFEGVENAELG